MAKIIICKNCGEEKEHKAKGMCRSCYDKKYREKNKEKLNKYNRNYTYKRGGLSMKENKSCPMFLGNHVAKRVLSKAFKDVKQMPNGNKDFDFVCSKDKKVNVKSSVLHYHNRSLGYWSFLIRKNAVADYFLCLAFDNREDLNPLHVWLVPGEVINNLTSTSISSSTLSKWKKYEKKLDKVVDCCNTMKN